MMRLRFAVLQTMLVAGIVALFTGGTLDAVMAGEGRWFVASVAGVAMTGLGFAFAGRLALARWVGGNLLPLAVIGMQVGILAGLAVAGRSMLAGGDAQQAVGGFFAAISAALHVSVTALSGYLWINLTLKIMAPHHAD